MIRTEPHIAICHSIRRIAWCGQVCSNWQHKESQFLRCGINSSGLSYWRSSKKLLSWVQTASANQTVKAALVCKQSSILGPLNCFLQKLKFNGFHDLCPSILRLEECPENRCKGLEGFFGGFRCVAPGHDFMYCRTVALLVLKYSQKNRVKLSSEENHFK